MVTENGLRPLGMHSQAGEVREGRLADFAIFDDAAGGDFETIFDGIIRERSASDLTAVAGRITHDAKSAVTAVA
jgi:predicted amidohydrolase YtcJ